MPVHSVLTAPQLLWEVLARLSVHRWLWKAPLQWNKPSLSLASMARACCLTISEELRHQALPRTARTAMSSVCKRRAVRGWGQQILHSFDFHFKVWRLPHENRSNFNSFFHHYHSTLPPYSLFSNHTLLVDWRPVGPWSPEQPYGMFHRVVGDMASMDERTCDAGWPGELWSRCLWITE